MLIKPRFNPVPNLLGGPVYIWPVNIACMTLASPDLWHSQKEPIQSLFFKLVILVCQRHMNNSLDPNLKIYVFSIFRIASTGSYNILTVYL